jgi:DNA repair exonuclease SbcCD ATPase subunit
MSAFHKIRSIEVTGGFLEGLELQFGDDLNCIIGGRGTGKTTVLEALRYALDRMPDPETDRDRYVNIERLLAHNLAGGTIRVSVETRDGMQYNIERGFGETPLVTRADGTAIDVQIGRDTLFGVDIYSQNQIEEIANDAYSQLELVDKFVSEQVEILEDQIATVTKALEGNGTKILDARRAIDDLAEATRALADVSERIRGFELADPASGGETVRQEHERKALRAREAQLVELLRAFYEDGTRQLAALVHQLEQRHKEASEVDVSTSLNRDLIARVRKDAELAVESVARAAGGAKEALQAAGRQLVGHKTQLLEQHALQEKQYRDLVEKHEQERAKGVERTRLEQRHAELKAKGKQLLDKKAALASLAQERDALRTRLSELRDQRFALRHDVVEKLNKQLAPMIRIRIEQFGNMTEYRQLLNQSMKGSGLRYAAIVDRAVERLPPAELAALVQSEDRVGLERELDLDADRATRLIIQLKDKPEIFAIETVELHDRPILELKDGEDYKESTALSTGQKCTTILPILLMESERPLLIDQPEDNLDNAFVFETIVQSIAEVRGRRQLIFVTHNPNIPVLGDAARVFALRSTGRAASVANAGTVDDVAGEIMTILEGGRVAFEARRERYGRPVPERKTKPKSKKT